jgi:two-component system sensor histidine kinase ChvG
MRPFSRLSLRLLAFNLLLVFLPVAGFLYLDVYERRLLAAQERAMVQQGRLVAAALGGHSTIEPAAAAALLGRLERRSEARLRVFDASGALLADSSLQAVAPAPPRPPGDRWRQRQTLERAAGAPRDSLLYRIGAALYRVWERVFAPAPAGHGTDRYDRAGKPLLGPEVRAALAGRYGAATRPSGAGQRSVTLFSAVPVRDVQGAVVGAVLVAQSTLGLRAALADVRLDIFRVFLWSLLAASVLSLLVATTLTRPLQRLADEARALADRRGRLLGRLPGSARRDEIGDLARALEEMTGRLAHHLGFIESLAADVSHEFKNPLATIRGATELLAEVDDPADRAHFLAVCLRELARMERLLAGVREITGIDAHLPAEPAGTVDLRALLAELVEGLRVRGGEDGPRIVLAGPEGPVLVRASPERLVQLLDNVLDNARSFSPPGGTVTVELAPAGSGARIRVDDQGPGVAEAHRQRIFDRFFSQSARGGVAAPGEDGHGAGELVKGLAEGDALGPSRTSSETS